MRLQKYIARCGVTSRRKAEDLIRAGRVRVNGEIIEELGTKVRPGLDQVSVDNRPIELEEEGVYILLNKPRGYVTTLDDEFNRPKVMDLIKGVEERVYPVGRLDRDTEGLLLLSNDGALTHKLTHPSFEVEKTYQALVKGRLRPDEIEAFRRGLMIDGVRTYPAGLRVLRESGDQSLIEVVIHEGRNRQVRKMCQEINHPVVDLRRISFGPLDLGGLRPGEYRPLTGDELDLLRKL